MISQLQVDHKAMSRSKSGSKTRTAKPKHKFKSTKAIKGDKAKGVNKNGNKGAKTSRKQYMNNQAHTPDLYTNGKFLP